MFLLSAGKAGKLFINELTKLFNAWIDDSPLTPESSNEGCYDNAQFAPSKALKGKSIKGPSESTSMKD